MPVRRYGGVVTCLTDYGLSSFEVCDDAVSEVGGDKEPGEEPPRSSPSTGAVQAVQPSLATPGETRKAASENSSTQGPNLTAPPRGKGAGAGMSLERYEHLKDQIERDSIGFDDFVQLIRCVDATRKALVGGSAGISSDSEKIRKVFLQNSTPMPDGTSRMMLLDFKHAVRTSPAFLALLGVLPQELAVDTSAGHQCFPTGRRTFTFPASRSKLLACYVGLLLYFAEQLKRRETWVTKPRHSIPFGVRVYPLSQSLGCPVHSGWRVSSSESAVLSPNRSSLIHVPFQWPSAKQQVDVFRCLYLSLVSAHSRGSSFLLGKRGESLVRVKSLSGLPLFGSSFLVLHVQVYERGPLRGLSAGNFASVVPRLFVCTEGCKDESSSQFFVLLSFSLFFRQCPSSLSGPPMHYAVASVTADTDRETMAAIQSELKVVREELEQVMDYVVTSALVAPSSPDTINQSSCSEPHSSGSHGGREGRDDGSFGARAIPVSRPGAPAAVGAVGAGGLVNSLAGYGKESEEREKDGGDRGRGKSAGGGSEPNGRLLGAPGGLGAENKADDGLAFVLEFAAGV